MQESISAKYGVINRSQHGYFNFLLIYCRIRIPRMFFLQREVLPIPGRRGPSGGVAGPRACLFSGGGGGAGALWYVVSLCAEIDWVQVSLFWFPNQQAPMLSCWRTRSRCMHLSCRKMFLPWTFFSFCSAMFYISTCSSILDDSFNWN